MTARTMRQETLTLMAVGVILAALAGVAVSMVLYVRATGQPVTTMPAMNVPPPVEVSEDVR